MKSTRFGHYMGTVSNSWQRYPAGSFVASLGTGRDNDDFLDPQRQAEFLPHIASPANRVSWSPGQAADAPDTHEAGDIRTAWASQNPDGGPKWLRLESERSTEIDAVELVERDGSRQWAKSTTASSYYGPGRARELNTV